MKNFNKACNFLVKSILNAGEFRVRSPAANIQQL